MHKTVNGTQRSMAGAVALFSLCLAGCSTQAQRVDCAWNLKPINQPVARSVPTPPPSSSTKNSQAKDEK